MSSSSDYDSRSRHCYYPPRKLKNLGIKRVDVTSFNENSDIIRNVYYVHVLVLTVTNNKNKMEVYEKPFDLCFILVHTSSSYKWDGINVSLGFRLFKKTCMDRLHNKTKSQPTNRPKQNKRDGSVISLDIFNLYCVLFLMIFSTDTNWIGIISTVLDITVLYRQNGSKSHIIRKRKGKKTVSVIKSRNYTFLTFHYYLKNI